jgi:hypothetical protein
MVLQIMRGNSVCTSTSGLVDCYHSWTNKCVGVYTKVLVVPSTTFVTVTCDSAVALVLVADTALATLEVCG